MLHLSYTSANAYNHCPLFFRCKYHDRLPERPRGEFNLGNALHAAFEFFYKGSEPPTLDAFLDAYASEWESVGFKTKEDEQSAFKAGEGWLRGYHAKFSAGYRRPLYVEHKFEVDLGDIAIMGAIDRVDRMQDGKLEIIDYKSGDVTPEEVKANLQLGIYQIAMEEEMDADIGKLTIFHIPTLTAMSSPPRSEEEMKAIGVEMARIAKGVRRKYFEPKRSDWCPCDYASLCPFYRHLYSITHAGSKLIDLRGICEKVDAYAENILSGKGIDNSVAVEGEIRRFMHANDLRRVYGLKFALELKENRLLAEEITQMERDEIL